MLLKNINLLRVTSAFICCGALILGGCASHKTKNEIPPWDANQVAVTPPAPVSHAPQQPLLPPVPIEQGFTKTTNFAGCTGSFVVQSNGNFVKKGRAFNAPEGLYVLDARGNRTNQIVNSTLTNTVYFVPDCNCPGSMGDVNAPNDGHKHHSNCNK